MDKWLGTRWKVWKVEEMSGSAIQGATQCSSWGSQMELHHLLEWRSWNGTSWQMDCWGENQWWQQNTYWTQFENYIHPQTNQLIAVVELKPLFQGSLSLEDFHTKALRLVTQAGYEGDAKDRVLRDTIISGLDQWQDQGQDCEGRSWSKLEQSHGDSKAGSFHTTAFGEDARDCKGELCSVWKIHQI